MILYRESQIPKSLLGNSLPQQHGQSTNYWNQLRLISILLNLTQTLYSRIWVNTYRQVKEKLFANTVNDHKQIKWRLQPTLHQIPATQRPDRQETPQTFHRKVEGMSATKSSKVNGKKKGSLLLECHLFLVDERPRESVFCFTNKVIPGRFPHVITLPFCPLHTQPSLLISSKIKYLN